jgi:hypothetical protein
LFSILENCSLQERQTAEKKGAEAFAELEPGMNELYTKPQSKWQGSEHQEHQAPVCCRLQQ